MSISDVLKRLATKLSKVFDAGKDAEWNRFWDEVQQNGTRNAYSYAFSSSTWNDNTFKPKYDITFAPNVVNYIEVFRSCSITDLKGLLERQGVKLDTSGCSGTSAISLFNLCTKLTRVPTLDLSNLKGSVGSLFTSCSALQYVEKMILSENGTKFTTASFQNCNALEEIRFEGKIASDIYFGDCTKLSAESVDSIIDVLSDTTTGMTCTFFLTQDLADNWEELVARKPNWRIACV